MVDKKAATGPSKFTREQLKKTTETKEEKKVAGRLKAAKGPRSSSFIIVLDDCGVTMTAKWRANDSFDESIVFRESPNVLSWTVRNNWRESPL